MISRFDSLPSEVRTDIKNLGLSFIRQVDVTNYGDCTEISVSGTNSEGYGVLKIFRYPLEKK